jgi:hypothetical protein
MGPAPPAIDSLRSDLRWALWVMRRQISIPLLAAGIATLGSALDQDSLLVGLFLAIYALAMFGWFGASNVWFRRAAADDWLQLRQLPGLIARFIGPFLRFGLLIAIPYYVLLAVFDALDTGFPRWLSVVLSVVSAIGIFVFPTLALSTRRARSAIVDGVRAFFRWWPACLPYALLTLGVSVLGAVADAWRVPLVLTTPIFVVANLAIAGAVVAFYLRRVPVGRDGVAYAEPEVVSPPPLPDRPDGGV